jgi:hypothetical protein
VEVPHQADLNLLGDWTVEAWFKDESPLGFNHDYTNLINKGDREANAEAPYAVSIGFKTLVASVRTKWTDYTVQYDLRTGGVDPTKWHHVAATFQSSTRTLILYLDGTERARSVLGASSTGNTLPLQIGRNGPVSRKYFQGKLDDVRIWNVVRSASDIASSYPGEMTAPATGLVANWQFNDPNGTTATDSAGSHDGLLRDGALFSSEIHP